MTCKLVVTGEGSTTPENVAGVLAYHRSRGRTWFHRRPRPVPAGTRVAAKVAGVSELWMTGTVRTGIPYLDPDSPNPDRWPWAMDIDWEEPAERGIPIGEVYGTTGVYARGMLINIDPDEFAASERLLYAYNARRAGHLPARPRCLHPRTADNPPVNRTEAAQVADARLSELRRVPYRQLVEEWLKQPRSESARAPSGREYQLEIEAVWDDRSEGHLRVWVLVDDGGWRASFPVTRALIVAPDGSFIDE